MGLKSGEYGGRKTTQQAAATANSLKIFLRCQEALSMTITLPAGISFSNTSTNHSSNSLLFILHVYSHLPIIDFPHCAATIFNLVNFLTYAEAQYNKIIQAAKDTLVFGYAVHANLEIIRLYISFIRKYNDEIALILKSMHQFVDENPNELFIKQIHLLQTIKGAGFLSAVTVMVEIGAFSVFSKPKQLLAYFGLAPSVKQSGNFVGTRNKMSKRGSAIARRAIHTIATVNIRQTKNGSINPVLRQYYEDKCKSKLNLVALGAVSHKVCNIIFAVLRDNKPFSVISKDDHIRIYQEKLAAGNELLDCRLFNFFERESMFVNFHVFRSFFVHFLVFRRL